MRFSSVVGKVRSRRGGTRGIGWIALGLTGVLLVTPLRAADWPQWRGPQRNGISTETGWLTRWPGGGPKRLWAAQVGEGFASVAVSGGRVYTMGNSRGTDTVFCLAADTGRVVWRQSYPCQPGDYGGSRATPTVEGNRVYTLSREAQAYCFDAATGKVVWNKDLRRETGAEEPRWGFAGSPLVEGRMVVYNVGAGGCGLDKATGRVVWRSHPSTAGYASPVAYTVGGQRGVAIFAASGILGLDPGSGRVQWQYPWQTQFDVNAADPIFAGDQVFISSNYGRGGALLRVGRGRPAPVWENRNMRNHANGCVLVGGYLYGNDQGTLKCIDLRTGAERWQNRSGLDKGGLIAVGGNLLVLTGRGQLTLVKPNPNAYTELASAQVLRGTCWSHPVLANGLIYCRSHEGELVCLDVRGKK